MSSVDTGTNAVLFEGHHMGGGGGGDKTTLIGSAVASTSNWENGRLFEYHRCITFSSQK